ncbi:E3 SUMO-protein ligase MMS21 [Chlorella vulgaris]
MEAIAWNSQPVLGCVNTQLSRHTAYAQGCEGSVEGMGDVAALFSAGGGDPDKVGQLQGAVAQLLQARHRSQLHAAALQELAGAYQAGPEPTDFKTLLAQRTQQLEEQQPYSAQHDPLMQDFLAAAGGGAADQPGAGDEQIDEDIAIEGGARQLAPNATCPITTRPLLLLDDPVEDSFGVVYERIAVEQFFRTLPPQRHGRAIIMAGSSHEVTLAEMKPAEKVIREKRRQARRQRLGGGAAAAAAGGDVLDV